MFMPVLRSRFVFLCLMAMVARTGPAQTVTGSILGSIRDSSGLLIAGATVTANHVSTSVLRETKSDSRGDYVFNALPAGEYTLSVNMEGFKPTERRGIVLSTGERLALNPITLNIGLVTEQVTVTAEGTPLQTASTERSGLITSSQVDNLLIKGRNVMSLLQLLPGVVDPADNDSISRNWSLNVNGNRGNMNNVTLDGLSLINVGGGQGHVVQIGQDTVAEVKVLLSNYQAEYGLMAGANVTMVTKSGTRDFHGLGSYFKRHEQFNANNFFSNRLGQPKPRSRYNVWNYNIGGPVLVPGKFNQSREKLFFFWFQEFWPTVQPQSPRQLTVPTELERAGDFSQSVDVNNRPIVVSDPLNNRQPFPGNRIPANRIDPSGQALLNAFPLPNVLDRNVSRGNYNYAYQTENRQLQKINLLKLDYHLNANHLISGTSAGHNEEYEGYIGLPTSGSTNWPQMQKTYSVSSRTYQVRYQGILSPTLINELNLGHVRLNGNDVFAEAELLRNERSTAGFAAGQLYFGSNPLGVLPNVTFDVPNAANLAFEGRFPFRTRQHRMDISNNLTRTWGAHTTKAGIFVDRVWSSPSISNNFNGALNFSRSANNPLDSGYSYANAILGNYLNYTESSRSGLVHVRALNVESFAQDNWRVNRQLTLDVGMRFSVLRPLYERDNLVSTFSPEHYDPQQQVHLIAPAVINGGKVGVDPRTGATYPQSLIGALVPGSGNPANGMVTANDSNYPRGLVEDRGVHYAPRIGLVWDVFGQGHTAVRSGFGVFYNRPSFDSLLTGGYATQFPVVETPTLVNGTLGSMGSASGFQFPASVLGLDRIGKTPTVMNFNASVQQNIGFGTVVDVGYTGSLGRHLMWARDLNTIPAGANFRPENADTTNPSVSLPSSFLRPIQVTAASCSANGRRHRTTIPSRQAQCAGTRTGCSSAPPGRGRRRWVTPIPTRRPSASWCRLTSGITGWPRSTGHTPSS
jgi:hypothetical protein